MRSVVAVIALVACVHAGLWALATRQSSAPAFDGQLASVSYAPFAAIARSRCGDRRAPNKSAPTSSCSRRCTRSIRTYSSTGGVELVPGIAREFGLRVTVGAWIDKNTRTATSAKSQSAIDLARGTATSTASSSATKRSTAATQTVADLIKQDPARQARRVRVPVTTGEIWNVWIEHPELVSAVDYIAAHVLPYWEGLPARPRRSIRRSCIYDKLRQAYPGKRIVIAEFGWPSAGYNYHERLPGPHRAGRGAARFRRARRRLGIDYNIIEAFDQPWKTFEGGVGPYWGLFDAQRQPKFAWTGPIADPDHWKLAGIALLLGVLLSLPILGDDGVTVRPGGVARGRRQCGRRLVRHRVRLSGTAIIS